MLKHILSTDQFTDRKMVDELIELALCMEKDLKDRVVPQTLAGKIVACLFFEPSTRTRLSFETAVLRLGGQVIGMESGMQTSSTVKGEILEDTIRIVNGYADAIVMRHPKDGAAEAAAKVTGIPIVNAGDGGNQHPTQALLDLLTMKKEKGKLDGLKIAMVGDLLYGRTVHSLLPLLALYDNIKLYFVAPAALAMPEKYKNFLKEKNVAFEETENLDDVLGVADVVYQTRVQKERFGNADDYNKVKDSYIFDSKVLAKLNKDAIVMHPLPRVNEISLDWDTDSRAAYFRQARNGLYMRMALLHCLLGK